MASTEANRIRGEFSAGQPSGKNPLRCLRQFVHEEPHGDHEGIAFLLRRTQSLIVASQARAGFPALQSPSLKSFFYRAIQLIFTPMKKLIVVALLIAILGSMYGYVLGRGISGFLLAADPAQIAALHQLRFGASIWDQIVFWTGPIFALLLIWPAVTLGFELYCRDREKKAPLEERILAQLKEFLVELAEEEQKKALNKAPSNQSEE